MQITRKSVSTLAFVAVVGFALSSCGTTKTVTKTVKVPGPTVTKTVNVPGPTVHELPVGCGEALVAYETAVNNLIEIEGNAWGHASDGVLGQADVDATGAALDDVKAADTAAADTCMGGGATT